jgi:hypothetical protein
MSRAFVREDRDDDAPEIRFTLPPPDDPSYDAAAAFALLEGARAGLTSAAESATGYRWGEPALHVHVRRLLEREEKLPLAQQDARLITVARRFLASS